MGTETSSQAGAASSTERDWAAEWIWWAGAPEREENSYVLFQRSLEVPEGTGAARVRVTADCFYELFVNGERVARGPARSNAGSRYYDELEIGAYLRAGANSLAAIVSHPGVDTERYILGRGGFLFELTLETPDGELTVGTDAEWRAKPSATWVPTTPRENLGNGFVESADLGAEGRAWLRGEGVEGWQRAAGLGSPPQEPWETLLRRDIPMLREWQRLPVSVWRVAEVSTQSAESFPLQVEAEVPGPLSTVEVTEPRALLREDGVTTVRTPSEGKHAVIMLDLGEEVCGHPFVELSGPAGTIVDVAFSEQLLNGRVIAADEEFLGLPCYTCDRFTLGAGEQRWERFDFSGLRYLQLTVRVPGEGEVQLRRVGITAIEYPYEARGSFACSDPLLGRIWEIGADTTRDCTQDTYVDCPWREKGQWIDLVTPLVSYYAFGDRAVAARFLRTLATGVREDGLLSLPYPSGSLGVDLPDQAMWWGMHLAEYHLHFDDRGLLEDLFPALRQITARFERARDQRGLIACSRLRSEEAPLWAWIDWGHQLEINLPGLFKHDTIAALNVYYVAFQRAAAEVARTIGETEAAARYASAADATAAGINGAFWDEAKGFYWDDLERTDPGIHAGILAVSYGLAPEGRREQILRHAIDDEGYVGNSSPHFYLNVFDALSRSGLYQWGLELMRQRWGGMLADGATAWWEQFKPWDYPMPGGPETKLPRWSFCHAYSSAPTYSLSRTALGVTPLEPAFRRARVEPQLGDLTWASGTVPTPQGEIGVDWRRYDAGRFELSVDVPAGITAEVVLPGSGGSVQELGEGIHYLTEG